MPETTLRELLKTDFELELDIGDGWGQSEQDPIAVLSDSEDAATYTELLVLRGLGMGRGIFWRSVSAQFSAGAPPQILRRKIETKKVTRDEIKTRLEDYYFTRENLVGGSEQVSKDLFIYHDQEVMISFPYELGWLHFDDVRNYEKEAPGLGYSLAYGAPGIKVTIYIYPIPDENPSPSRVETELLKARNDIIMMSGEESIRQDWDIENYEDYSVYRFVTEQDPDTTSLLMVSTKGSYFIKLRCTYITNELLREIASDLLAKLLELKTSADAEDPVLKREQEILEQIENAAEVRGREELCSRLGIAIDDFNQWYVAYRMTLEISGADPDAEIDKLGIENGAFTKEEASFAVENDHQWILNRIALRYVMGKEEVEFHTLDDRFS